MTIRLYWSGGNRDEINFGDTLSPIIVKSLSGKDVVYAGIDTCDIAAIGSLLDKIISRKWKRLLRLRFDQIRIWGTGSFGPDTIANHSSGLSFSAVRGPLTRDALKLDPETPLGDPGLLVETLVKKGDKKYRWGIIPHVTDRRIDSILELEKSNRNTRIIDLGNPDILSVAREISSCDFVISTSLHGLITADAFGVPNVWMRVSNNVFGGDWKFLDYFSSIGRVEISPLSLTREPISLKNLEDTATKAPRTQIETLQKGLNYAFRSMGL